MANQLNEALETLDNTYPKADFVIAEIYRNLKALPQVTSFKTSTKVAQEQVHVIKISLATLKSLGYEQELVKETNLQNTFLLVDLESRIPMEAYTAWVAEKEKIKNNGKTANLEDFSGFYEKLVMRQKDALYLRRQIEEINKDKKEHPTTKPNKGDDKPVGKNLLAARTTDSGGSYSSEGEPPVIKGKYKKAWCIFEKCNGHHTSYCLNQKFDHAFKLAAAKKEGVCLICLKTTNHKEKDCTSKFKSCLICGKQHNVNLHARKDVIEAFKKKKAGKAKSD